MSTYFLPSECLNQEALKSQIEMVNQSPLITALLDSVCGLVAVLNEQCQIVALNEGFLETMGIIDAGQSLGLRFGEALKCTALADSQQCGTGQLCRSCGVASAISTALAQNKVAESVCALQTSKNGMPIDLFLRVRCSPIVLSGTRFLVLFLQDNTRRQRLAALEQVFFRDVKELASSLVSASSSAMRSRSAKWPKVIHQLALKLAQEIAMQRQLANEGDYQPLLEDVTVKQLVQQVLEIFSRHPAAEGKNLTAPARLPSVTLRIDAALVIRLLSNMITNALEATPETGEVKLPLEKGLGAITFAVWNQSAIPPEIMDRIFQRNFSTKQLWGKGLGTYSMKIFGEQFLGGRISFTSSEAEGTTFRLTLGTLPHTVRRIKKL
jgi:hypothetical protein